jgi:hypothetical protein
MSSRSNHVAIKRELKVSDFGEIEFVYFVGQTYFFFVYSYVHTIFGSFLLLTSHPLPSPPIPPTPDFQAETVLPLSVILLKREYKQ